MLIFCTPQASCTKGTLTDADILYSAGSLFDGNGTQNSWWSPEDKNNFDNKTQCIIDQNVYVDEINMTVSMNAQFIEFLSKYKKSCF